MKARSKHSRVLCIFWNPFSKGGTRFWPRSTFPGDNGSSIAHWVCFLLWVWVIGDPDHGTHPFLVAKIICLDCFYCAWKWAQPWKCFWYRLYDYWWANYAQNSTYYAMLHCLKGAPIMLKNVHIMLWFTWCSMVFNVKSWQSCSLLCFFFSCCLFLACLGDSTWLFMKLSFKDSSTLKTEQTAYLQN